MSVAYNEIDEYAVDYMRFLMAGDLIAPGHIFTCSIEDLTPRDLAPFKQFHAFSGMGVWSYALRQAGVRDDTELFTGSCPCQPFSAAGKGMGFADERHLWPAFLHLINAVRPIRVFGEQVAGKDGLAWLDLVSSDLEGHGYACRAVPLCSAGFGGPDIRNRLYWVADALGSERPDADRSQRHAGVTGGRLKDPSQTAGCGELVGLEDAQRPGQRAPSRQRPARFGAPNHAGASNGPCGLADSPSDGRRQERADAGGSVVGDRAERVAPGPGASGGDMRPGPLNGFWRDADWLFCRDGKWRPVEPGSSPLDTGSPARVGRLRTAGNAVNAQVAIEFIKAVILEDQI